MCGNVFPEISISEHARAGTANDRLSEWIRFSVPLEEGNIRGNEMIFLSMVSGRRLRIQSRPLALWGDGSVRWLDCQAIVEESGACTIGRDDGSVPVEDPRHPVKLDEDEGTITMDNGLVAITLSADGTSPVREISHRGRTVTPEGQPFEAEVLLACGSRYSSCNDSRRALSVHMQGPVRCVAEACGQHLDDKGERVLSYRLRVEVIADLPVIVLHYWMKHLDPGKEYHHLDEVTVHTRWSTPESPTRYLQQLRYSTLSIRREVETKQPVDIRVGPDSPHIHVQNSECLNDDNDYPEFMNPPMNDSSPYLGLDLGEGVSVVSWVDDFRELYPSALTSEGNDISLSLWPRWADATDMHQGWSRQMTQRLVFSEGQGHPGMQHTGGLADATRDRACASLCPGWYAERKCWLMDTVLPLRVEKPVRSASDYLTGLCGLSTVMGMWDLGDTVDPGYTSTYSFLERNARLPGLPPQQFITGKFPPEWMRQNMMMNEPVWANNEYDLIICFARECMRGGLTPGLWQKLGWFVRHNIEVDFIHYSDHPQMHHGSPAHSVRHCKASAYPSHLWCEGLLAYYCLSGDDDVLNVAVMMGDFILETFADAERRAKLWHFSRELGWALLYLACIGDITRERRFLDLAGEMAEMLMSHARDDGLAREMIKTAFGYSSIALGVEMLHRVTGEQRLADWLIAMADHALRLSQEGMGAISGMAMNYLNAAYAITNDRKYVLDNVNPREFIAENRGEHPWPYTKQVAMNYRPLCRYLKAAAECL